ncbi:XylR N-terminal domain-containing protein [Fredinandcohnia humi]
MGMKAHHLHFQNLVDINPRTGTIMLHDKRMVLMSVEALGILRRDLIDTLGIERAKGFLMRYGWACGYRDGESIEKMFEWDSIEELMLSGPALHTLEGVVTVEADRLELSDDKLYFSGSWVNSYEADEHIHHYGHHDEAVCWSLIGYASGFLTKTFGRKVLVSEKYCRGKKDEKCYFVAKTIEDCDEKALDDLRYYNAESLQSELDRVHQEVQELNRNIIESEKIQKELTELLLEDKDIQQTTTFISSVLQRSVVIDHLNKIHSATFTSDFDELAYQKWITLGKTTNGLQFETFDIKGDKRILGRLVLMGEQPTNTKEKMIIERVLMVCTIQMFHQWKLIQSRWRKKEDFFDDILNGVYDEETFERQAHIFEYNANEPNRILAIKITPKGQLQEVLQFLSMEYYYLDVFQKNEYILIILPDKETDNIEQYLLDMLKNVQRKFLRVKAYIGSGRVTKSVGSLSKSFQDAASICDFIQLAYPSDSRSATYEELEPITLFLKGTDQEELFMFCTETIGKLVAYDEANQSNLVVSLKSYLDYNGNLQQTAKDLHLSVAGLRYRIEKIESLCDIDLKTGSGRFKCQLAIRIYLTLQILNKNYINQVKGV